MGPPDRYDHGACIEVIGIGIGVAVGFCRDIDHDSDSDSDPDTELYFRQSIFESHYKMWTPHGWQSPLVPTG